MDLTLSHDHRHRSLGRPAQGGLEALGRFGLAARGVVYLLIAWLALLVAFGNPSREADREGAIATVAAQPFGRGLLVAMAIGFAGYALWRLAEAATGQTSKDKDAGIAARLASAAKGLFYGATAFATLRYALADHPEARAAQEQSGGQEEQAFTAEVLGWPGGRWIVAAVGLAIIGYGLYNLYRGIAGTFMERLKQSELHGASEDAVRGVGTVGHVGRGVAFGLIGLFVMRAAFDLRPDEARGLDGVLKEVAAASYGQLLLVLLAVGVAAFGLYSLAEARWRRVLGS